MEDRRRVEDQRRLDAVERREDCEHCDKMVEEEEREFELSPQYLRE